MLSVFVAFFCFFVVFKISKGLFYRSNSSGKEPSKRKNFYIVQIQSGPQIKGKNFLDDVKSSIKHLRLGENRMTWIRVDDRNPNSIFMNQAVEITRKIFEKEIGQRHPILILNVSGETRERFQSISDAICVLSLDSFEEDRRVFNYTICPVCYYGSTRN